MRNKSKIIYILLVGIILCSGIVYASNYSAIDITYNHSNWKVDNVNDALNDLYNNASKIYPLGTGVSFNIKELVPNVDYTKLIVSDFIVEVIDTNRRIVAYGGDTTNGHYSFAESELIKDYNAETGVLTAYLHLQTDIKGWSDEPIYNTATTKVNVNAYLIRNV